MKELGKRYSQDEDKYNDSQLAYLQIRRDLEQDVEGYRTEKKNRMVEVSQFYIDPIQIDISKKKVVEWRIQRLEYFKLKLFFKVNELHDDDKIASDAVGEPTFYKSNPRTIPTDKEMQELKDHIKKMKVTIITSKSRNILGVFLYILWLVY